MSKQPPPAPTTSAVGPCPTGSCFLICHVITAGSGKLEHNLQIPITIKGHGCTPLFYSYFYKGCNLYHFLLYFLDDDMCRRSLPLKEFTLRGANSSLLELTPLRREEKIKMAK